MRLHNRSSVRKDKHYEVDVNCNDVYLGRGMITDIHTDGAFISNCPGEIILHDQLDLYVVINAEDHATIHLVGMVMRVCDKGVGVLFSYSEPEFRRLLKLIHSDDGMELGYGSQKARSNDMLSRKNFNSYMVDRKQLL